LIFDVIIDIRPGSATYLQWFGIELSAKNRLMLYVPEGYAHGYQTLADDAEIFYMVSQFYAPDHESGIRWDDPLFGIRWPIGNPILSPKDSRLPDFRPGRPSLKPRRSRSAAPEPAGMRGAKMGRR
jgi:dTDP-4-dehydrorhamnose 3,5-epimerase